MVMRTHISFFLVLMTLFFANAAEQASAAVVYPGCAAPPTSSGNVHYVDPVHGSPLGNGSRLQPWRTLPEVIAAGLFATTPTYYSSTLKKWIYTNPNAPIKPGDTVYLMSGDHGSVVLQGQYGNGLVGYYNSQFITISAYPGQTPIFENLSIRGGAKWVFQGITIQSNNNPRINGYGYTLVTLLGDHSDIVLRNNILQSQSNTSAWTITDWGQKRANGIQDELGKCIAITGNVLRNIGFGIVSQRSNGVLISGNTIDRFTDDGIDYGSSYMLIEGNRITNSIEDGDGIHRDGMQGQPYPGTVLTNVTITSNTIIRITDPTLPYPAELQGIDEFDGTWNNVAVINNVVITDLWNGVAYWGVHNAVISGNIILPDSGKVLPCLNLRVAACLTKSVIYDTSASPGVVVHASKGSVPSSHVTVTNNIATEIEISPGTIAPLVISGNACVSLNGRCPLEIPVNGYTVTYSKPGTYPGNNVITSVGPAGMFVTYDPAQMIYNLTLRPGVHS